MTTTSSSVPTFDEGPNTNREETTINFEGSLTDVGYVFVACYEEDNSDILLKEF